MIRVEIVSAKMSGRSLNVEMPGVPRVGETIMLTGIDAHLTVRGVAWRDQPAASGADVTVAVHEGW